MQYIMYGLVGKGCITMPRQTYVPVSRKKSGCFKNVLLLAAIVFMIYACLYLGPQIMRQDNSKAPGFLYQIQKMLQQGTPATTSKQHSSTLSSPSGSCFDLARTAAIQHGIDPTLYARQINQESGCQASICSPAGACGAAQLMPEMATSLGVNPMNVEQSLQAGAHLMAGYLKLYNGSWALALACYNAGTGATAYALRMYGNSWYAHLPLETQDYITAILGSGVQA